jgi:hypothetical protein
MSCNKNKIKDLVLGIEDRCCKADTGCQWDGTLRRVKTEPIYVQKVYDAALFNLQGLKSVSMVPFTPSLGAGARIQRIFDIRCKKFFNPANINDPRNLKAVPCTTISGGQIVEDGAGNPVSVVGPDGRLSEFMIYADTQDCDQEGKGTPIFGTQTITVTGNVLVEIDALFTEDCGREQKVTLRGLVPVAKDTSPLVLTNFFELCLPSVFDSAFLPRFTEFCNIDCETRLATNSIARDIMIDPSGNVRINLIIALCITCEKKIIVPVQLCVLSTGFPVLSPDTAQICDSFPQLFPDQIDDTKSSSNEEF